MTEGVDGPSDALADRTERGTGAWVGEAPAAAPAAPSAAVEDRPTSARRARLLLGASLAVALLIVGVGALVVHRGGADAQDHRYVIPAGAAARLDAGEPLEVLPTELVVKAGDTLTVVNDDEEPHIVGVARVQPGETMTYEFPAAGQYESACTVHPRGAIQIVVEA